MADFRSIMDSRPWGGTATSGAREIVVITQREREREEVIRVLINGVT
jgi:hypothetical protein